MAEATPSEANTVFLKNLIGVFVLPTLKSKTELVITI